MKHIYLILILSLCAYMNSVQADNIYIGFSGSTPPTPVTSSTTTTVPTNTLNNAFLLLPFAKQEYTINEAWRYSDQEFSIHGYRKHEGIDFSLPYGTKIYAPTTGFVLATYQNAYINAGSGNVKALSGQAIHYGYGYYINFWDPKRDVFMIFAHLSSVARGIPFYAPKASIFPGTLNLKGRNSGLIPGLGEDIKEEILSNPSLFKKMKLVRPGQLLATVGVSGLERGEDFPLEVTKAPTSPAKQMPKSRDESHLHFELFQKSANAGKVMLDPFGLYSGNLALYSGNKAGGIWLRDSQGDIKFVR